MPFAGTDYLAKHGDPIGPRQLETLSALCMVRESTLGNWRLRHRRPDGDDFIVNLRPKFVSKDVWTLQNAASRGLGIAALPFTSVQSWCV